jgi:hypothetical protein
VVAGVVQGEPPTSSKGWKKKTLKNVVIEVPTDSKTEVQDTDVKGVVRKMTKFSFRSHVLDLELVFLLFASGTVGELDKAAENTNSEIERTSGKESLTPWQTNTVSGLPARHIATKPDARHQARQITLIDDTRAKDQLIIVDVSYDSYSDSGKTDCERIIKSVEIKN